jgi:hypothetical protein
MERNVECGHPQGINRVYPDIVSKRVKHYRNVEHGHSQEINFVALISFQSV